MSELKLVSPLLDGFQMGDPISEHDGVRCCPAMKENSDDKYIVKIISIPASQKKLDALLLTGAYRDAAAAAEYFNQLAEDTVKEARLLQQLSKLEGFVSYEGWQIVPMDNGETGFDVYLLGSYKRSLESHMRRNTMTHLGAVNLGIDLCTALSLCRRAGFIYMNLKPGNIYLSDQREYRIGDLGFAKLSAMKFTSVPTNYISRFTPPELHDPLATLNPTVDTYALGLVLYMIYNNGHIPFETKAPMMVLPAPLNADYELAEIILKACDPNPRKRYQTPVDMGKALVSYMQRNGVNDVPIVPPSAEPAPQAQEPAPVAVPPATDASPAQREPETHTSEELQFLDGLVSDDTAPGAAAEDDAAPVPMTDEADQILAQADDLLLHNPDIIPDTVEEEATPVEESPAEDITTPVIVTEEAVQEIPVGEALPDVPVEEPVLLPKETSTFVESALPAEDAAPTAPSEEVGTAEDPDFDVFLSSITGMTDSDEEDGDDDGNGDEEDDVNPLAELGLLKKNKHPIIPDSEDDFFVETKPRKKRGWIGILVLLLILALLGGGGYYYYNNYYLIPIESLTIDGFEDTLTIQLKTDADESLLYVVCTDNYGNKQEQAVSDGGAVFTDLIPDTMYKITVAADGFHKLTGSVSGSYTTAQQTKIVDFTAKNGIEDGSVILNFTVDGPETDNWSVAYNAEGEPTQSVSFTGHMVTINDLTVGKIYTFTLVHDPSVDLYLDGKTSLDFLASKVVVAENLSIVSCTDGVLTAAWSIPEDATVESWTVRCYSENGFNETVTVTEPTAQFSNISTDSAYTVEVTAAGMSQSAQAFVTANPATVADVQVTYTAETGMVVTWSSSSEPVGGWLVMYSLDGSETTEMAECTGTTATVKNVVPNATYSFRIMAADGSTVFGGTAEHPGIEQTKFDRHGLSADQIQSSLCHTPDKEGWTHEDVEDTDYTTSYAPGEQASLVMYTSARFYLKAEDTAVMFVIRDAEGKVIPTLIRTKNVSWINLWPGVGKYCYLDVPVMPTEYGDYTLEVYFNGATVLTKNFSIISAIG